MINFYILNLFISIMTNNFTPIQFFFQKLLYMFTKEDKSMKEKLGKKLNKRHDVQIIMLNFQSVILIFCKMCERNKLIVCIWVLVKY